MNSYRYASVAEVGARLRRREVSARELVREALRLAADLGPRHNAIASLLPERAEAQAAQLDRRDAEAIELSPLWGIPYAAKDLFAARGAPTTFGSPMYRSQQFTRDAASLRALTRRGAILAMKTAMSELAGGGTPSRPGASLHGQGRNPWDRARYSGGSSSGSAIVVALGIVPFALGTETGGSIISPTTYCGITGLRPTFGRVSRQGVMTLSWSLDKVGPIARSADDCALVMHALSPRFAASRGLAGRRLSDLRVAFSQRELEEVSEAVRGPLAAATAELERLGVTFVNTELRRNPDYTEALEEIVRVEGAFVFREGLRDPHFHLTDAAQQQSLAAGLVTPSSRYLEALRVTAAGARVAFSQVFREADLVLTAGRTDVAPLLDGPRPPRDPNKLSDQLRAAGNLAGIPAVSFPCGQSTEGLPVGLQLIGPKGSDRLILDVASAFQRATAFHRSHPPEA